MKKIFKLAYFRIQEHIWIISQLSGQFNIEGRLTWCVIRIYSLTGAECKFEPTRTTSRVAKIASPRYFEQPETEQFLRDTWGSRAQDLSGRRRWAHLQCRSFPKGLQSVSEPRDYQCRENDQFDSPVGRRVRKFASREQDRFKGLRKRQFEVHRRTCFQECSLTTRKWRFSGGLPLNVIFC